MNDKLLPLMKKYELDMDERFDRNYRESFTSSNRDATLFVSFSGRENGNCSDVAHYLLKEKDTLVLFKDVFYNPCSQCNYECFSSVCKYRYDDIYDLLKSTKDYKKVVFIVPVYCGNPPSLYFILSERMQDYFNHNEEQWDSFVKKLYFVCIYGSEEETPFFVNTFKSLVNDNSKILRIERHKYHLKMNNRIIDNNDIIKILDKFKTQLI